MTTHEHAPVVCLDRVADVDTPDYCVHGYVECAACFELCYLGDQTFTAVVDGVVIPVCMPCMRTVARGFVGRIDDSRH